MSEQTLPAHTAVRAIPSNPVVRVHVSHDIHNNLDKMQSVTKNILNQLGCPFCCSGFDIRYILETEYFTDPALNVHVAIPGIERE